VISILTQGFGEPEEIDEYRFYEIGKDESAELVTYEFDTILEETCEELVA
jgi:hypothetical protein